MSEDERLVVDVGIEVVHKNPVELTRLQINAFREKLKEAAVKAFKEASGFMEGWFDVSVLKARQTILNKEYCEETSDKKGPRRRGNAWMDQEGGVHDDDIGL